MSRGLGWSGLGSSGSSTLVHPSVTAWRPTNTIENTTRVNRWAESQGVLSSGRLYVMGGCVIPAGRAAHTIFFHSNGAAVTPTNQWFCLVDQALNVVAKTADDTTTAWGAGAKKTLTLSADYTPASDIGVYCGIVVVAATPPTLQGMQGATSVNQDVPILSAISTTGLTNPASLGATAGALSVQSSVVYCGIGLA